MENNGIVWIHDGRLRDTDSLDCLMHIPRCSDGNNQDRYIIGINVYLCYFLCLTMDDNSIDDSPDDALVHGFCLNDKT